MVGLAGYLSWNGTISRLGGLVLVSAYIAFVAIMWIVERRPPTLGETAELNEAAESTTESRVGIELVLVLVGVAALHLPWLIMLASLALVLVLAFPRRQLQRASAIVLLPAYPLFGLTPKSWTLAR